MASDTSGKQLESIIIPLTVGLIPENKKAMFLERLLPGGIASSQVDAAKRLGET